MIVVISSNRHRSPPIDSRQPAVIEGSCSRLSGGADGDGGSTGWSIEMLVIVAPQRHHLSARYHHHHGIESRHIDHFAAIQV